MSVMWQPIKSKCQWWREVSNEDDRYNPRIKDDDKRITGVCFVEGRGWAYRAADVPNDCPDWRKCRYYVKAM